MDVVEKTKPKPKQGAKLEEFPFEGPPIEIHVWPDRSAGLLRIEPRGLVERGALEEILLIMREAGMGISGIAERIDEIAAVLTSYGWSEIERWLEERTPGHRDLHVKLAKKVEVGRA